MIKEKMISIALFIFMLSCDGNEIQNITGSMDCMGDTIPIDCSDNSVIGCAYLNSCGICLGGSGIISIIEAPSGLAPKYQKLAGGPRIRLIM